MVPETGERRGGGPEPVRGPGDDPTVGDPGSPADLGFGSALCDGWVDSVFPTLAACSLAQAPPGTFSCRPLCSQQGAPYKRYTFCPQDGNIKAVTVKTKCHLPC